MSSRPPIQPLIDRVPIINPDGTPTQYFIRYLQERGIDLNDKVTAAQVEQMIITWSAMRSVLAGTGLSGGGTLDSDVTLALDAALGQLNDVDLITTPPADGEVLTYDLATNTWIPGAGGGGGGGGAAWQVLTSWDFAVDGALAQRIVDVSNQTDVIIVGVDVTLSASNWRGGAFSVDGGATYSLNTGDYTGISSAGGIAISDPGMFFHATASAAARRWFYRINNVNLSSPKNVYSNRADSCGIIGNVASAPITHIRISPVNAAGAPTGTFTGGKFWVLGRPKSSGGGGGGKTAIGSLEGMLSTTSTPSVNFYIGKLIFADADFSINKIAFQTTSATPACRAQPFVYAANASGVPAALLGSGPQIIGSVAGYNEAPLTAPVNVLKGDKIVVGLSVISAALANLWHANGIGVAGFAGNGGSSVPANPAPGFTFGTSGYGFWGVG